MRTAAFVLAWFAYSGNGRRLQTAENPSENRVQTRRTHSGKTLESLASLLQAGNTAAGWQAPVTGHIGKPPTVIDVSRSSPVTMVKWKKRGLLGQPKNHKGPPTWKGGRKVYGGLKRKKKSYHDVRQDRAKRVHERAVEIKLRPKPALELGWQHERYKKMVARQNPERWPVYARVNHDPDEYDEIMEHLYDWVEVGLIVIAEDADITHEEAAWVQKQVIKDWTKKLHPMTKRGSCDFDIGIAEPSNIVAKDLSKVKHLDYYLHPDRIPTQGLTARQYFGAMCGFYPKKDILDEHHYWGLPNPVAAPPPSMDASKVNINFVSVEGRAKAGHTASLN